MGYGADAGAVAGDDQGGRISSAQGGAGGAVGDARSTAGAPDAGAAATDAPSEPYLVVVDWDEAAGHTQLLGRPLARVNDALPLLLSAGTFDREFPFMSASHWSPDGRYLVFDAAWSDYDTQFFNRWYFVDFSTDPPSAARELPDLPRGVPIFGGVWDATSSAFSLYADGRPWLVRFDALGAAASELLVTSIEVDSGPELCRGAVAAVIWSGASGQLLPVGGGREPLELGSVSGLALSDDGRYLLVSRPEDDGGMSKNALLDCTVDAAAPEMGELEWSDGVFAPDSKHVAAELVSSTNREIVVTATATKQVVARHQLDGSPGVLEWSSNSSSLLVPTTEGDSHVWRFEQDLVETVPVTDLTGCHWVGERLLCESTVEESSEDLPVTYRVYTPFSEEPPVVFWRSKQPVLFEGDSSLSRVSFVTQEPEPTLVQVDFAAPDRPRRRSLAASSGGDLSIVLVAPDGSALLQWSGAAESELWWFQGAAEPGVLLSRAVVGLTATLQP